MNHRLNGLNGPTYIHIYIWLYIYMIETCIAGLEDNTQAETHHSGSPSCKRQIRLTNLRFKERIGRFPAAVSLLNKIGCSAVKLMAVRMEDNGSNSSDLACFHMFSLPSSNDAMRALFPSLPSHCIPSNWANHTDLARISRHRIYSTML